MTQHERLIENFSKAKSGEYYTIENIPAFLSAIGELRTVGKTEYSNGQRRTVRYYDVPASFDIETTSFEQDGVGYGTMYLWGFCVNGAVVIGRTWLEFDALLAAICTHLDLSPQQRLTVYVRNLGFEFQFIRKRYEWLDVFARQPRAPMKAISTMGIEFRCSYVLTGQKLEKSAEDLIELKVSKLSGAVDYSVKRHYLTPLTGETIQYQINDVLVDCSLINDKMRQDGNIANIPLTATGYTRRFVRRKCMPTRSNTRWQYYRKMQQQRITVDEYVMAKAAFAGGFTHASPLSCVTEFYAPRDGYIISEDFTSAYPAAMTLEAEFPVSKGFEVDPTTIVSRETLIDYANKFAFLGLFEFTGVQSKYEYDYFISASKTVELDKNAEVFNGRIAQARKFKTALCHIDFLTFLKCYRVRGIRVLKLYIYRKDYLPKPYIEAVLDRYENKTKLKQVAGREEDYMAAKRDTNALYGMLCTMLDRPEVIYKNDEWTTDKLKSLDEIIEEYNDKETRFINFLWGIYVTAICRRNLWDAILECKEDYLYSDTDSVKILNYDKHAAYFEKYNRGIDAKVQAVCAALDLNPDQYAPATIKGVKKPLGYWDFDGRYTRFKALRAKAYIYTTQETENAPEELHVTMAGVSKTKTAEYLLYKFKTIPAVFDAFNDSLQITGIEKDADGVEHGGTGKLTHLYNDVAFTTELTDANGVTATVSELSCINLSPCSFEVGFPEAFLKFLADHGAGITMVQEIMYN